MSRQTRSDLLLLAVWGLRFGPSGCCVWSIPVISMPTITRLTRNARGGYGFSEGSSGTILDDPADLPHQPYLLDAAAVDPAPPAL